MYAPEEKPLSTIELVDEALPARLLIADDHALIRGGIRTMLASDPDLEVIGEAADGEEALELCRSLSPDLVLMDVQMPKMDGLAATQAIKEELSGVIVLVVTAFEDPDYMLEAIRAGAAGYVLKYAPPQQLLEAVRGALGGESPLNQDLAMQLLGRLASEDGPRPSETKRQKGSPGSLTPRELDVLRHLASGKTNRQISHDLHLSLSTVKGYLERLISKLGVSDRTQAAVKAIELGLIARERRDGRSLTERPTFRTGEKMRRLTILFAAVGTALVLLTGGIALAQPSDNGSVAPPPGRGVDRDPQGNPYVAGELIVTYEERASARAADEANEEAEADIEVELPEIDAAVLTFPEVKAKLGRGRREVALKGKKKELEKDPSVESVSYNYLLQAQSDDELYGYQWGLPRIKAPQAWTITRGAKARIAVVDSGIQDDHPDLTGGVTFEHDYVQDDAVAQPTDLHATHVAGIAAARTDNGTGMAGTAPRAQLMDYKVVGPNGATFGDASQAIIDAAKAGAGVINVSIGGPTGAPVLEDAVNFAWNRGAVVVASAGNDFENGNPLNYPAAYPKVVAVGAVNKANARSNFSNVHPYMDVAAPGGSTVFGTPPENKILSSVPVSFTPGCGGNPNCYDFYAGTSQAAAFVSGVAALLDSRGLTNTQIRRRIEGTATDLGPAGKDNQYGHGLVNARAAVGR